VKQIKQSSSFRELISRTKVTDKVIEKREDRFGEGIDIFERK
jgi:hypothetical protein